MIFIEYLKWICTSKRLWALELKDFFKKCHYRQPNKFGEIVCDNPNCNGDFPNQHIRNFLYQNRFMVKMI